MNIAARTIIAGTLSLGVLTQTPSQQIAFPGAEGAGKFTPGGRGGRVCEVTNLNDNGPGSFRAAVKVNAPRTIVFRVSGTITLHSPLALNNPYVTIAGQTAPGDGICLRGYPLIISTDHVIIRYLRVRLGDESGSAADAMSAVRQRHIIVDHCSVSWSEDETMSLYGCDSLTVQWCIISESLYDSHHPKGAHGYGAIWGGANSSYHHNLFAHHSSRTPRFASGCGNTDFRNNVIYNWGFNSAYGGEAKDQNRVSLPSAVNVVANYYKPGPATRSGVRERVVNPTTRDGLNDYGTWFVAENIVEGSSAASTDNWRFGVQGPGEAEKCVIRLPEAAPYVPIPAHTAAEAYEEVLQHAGAAFPRRDTIDRRIVHEVRTGGATFEGKGYRRDRKLKVSAPVTGIIDSQSDVGGWPFLGSATASPDGDHDGMPDAWELAHGFNHDDPGDGSKIGPDGYSALEMYLNDLVHIDH